MLVATLLLLVPLLINLLFVAPFQHWKEKDHEVKALLKRLAPRIRVSGRITGSSTDKTAVLTVTNLSSKRVKNCAGYLKAVYEEIDGELQELREKARVYLQWSSRHGGIGQKEISFDSEAELDVAVVTVYSNGVLIVAFDDRIRDKFWLEERSAYEFDIEIAPENSVPIHCRYRLTVNPVGNKLKSDGIGGFIPRELPQLNFSAVND